MQWKFDTGKTGPVAATALKVTLQEARDHYLKTQADAAGLEASAQLGKGPDGGADAAGALAHGAKVQAAAEKMKQAYLLKSSEILAHMDLGIEAACKIAEAFGGGTVTATICGHDDPTHPSYVDRRMSVHVDQHPTRG